METDLDKLTLDIAEISRLSLEEEHDGIFQRLDRLDLAHDDSREHAINSNILPLLAKILQFSLQIFLTDGVTRCYRRLSAKAAFIVAELGKFEGTRKHIADADLIPLLVQNQNAANRHFLVGKPGMAEDDELVIQTSRAIANCCFDDDDNRDVCLEAGAIDTLLVNLKSNSSHMLVVTCGTFLNLSMDNEPIQHEIVQKGGMSHLFNLVKYAADSNIRRMYPDVGANAIRVISNLVEIEAGQLALLASCSPTSFSPSGSGLSLLLHLLKHHHNAILDADLEESEYDELLAIIELIVGVLEACSESDTIQRQLVEQNLLDYIMDFVDHRPASRLLHRRKCRVGIPAASDDEETAEGDEPIVRHTDYNEIRKIMSKIVALVTMNDTNMYELTHSAVLSRFLSWLRFGFSINVESLIEEDAIRMNGALSIGNLARSDETCVELARTYDVASPMIELLRLELERWQNCTKIEERKSMIKVIHAVIGAFKNLSLPSENKALLGSLGLINSLSALTEIEGVKPIQYGSVIVMKNLCALGNVENVYRVIVGSHPPVGVVVSTIILDAGVVFAQDTPLIKLMRVLGRATGDNDTGVRSEGSRVIVNMLKTCYQTQAVNLMQLIFSLQSEFNPLFPLVTLITGKALKFRKPGEETPQRNADTDLHVHFETVPAEGQVFPMLQNDAILAGICVLQAFPHFASDFTKFHSILNIPLLRLLADGVYTLPEDKEVRSSRSLSFMDDDKPSFGGVEKSSEYSDEFKCHAMLLIELIAKNDAKFKSMMTIRLPPVLDALYAKKDDISKQLGGSTSPLPPIVSKPVFEVPLVPRLTMEESIARLRALSA